MKDFKDISYNLVMFFKGFNEDQDVIHEHNYNLFIDELLENIIHHCLEGCWTVCEAEEHDKGLIQAKVGPEGCFPLISFFYMHIVVLLHDDYQRLMTELLSPLAVMSERLGFNLCVAL